MQPHQSGDLGAHLKVSECSFALGQAAMLQQVYLDQWELDPTSNFGAYIWGSVGETAKAAFMTRREREA